MFLFFSNRLGCLGSEPPPPPAPGPVVAAQAAPAPPPTPVSAMQTVAGVVGNLAQWTLSLLVALLMLANARSILNFIDRLFVADATAAGGHANHYSFGNDLAGTDDDQRTELSAADTPTGSGIMPLGMLYTISPYRKPCKNSG